MPVVPTFSLESNYGSPDYWARLVDHARALGVTRLIWQWTHPTRRTMALPQVYEWLPAFHVARDWEAEGALDCRRDLAACAQQTRRAGMEFYLEYPVLHFNLSAREKLAQQLPDLFGDQGVPDAGRPFFSHFVKEQLRELYRDFPLIDGVVLWMCEVSDFHPLRLAQHVTAPGPAPTDAQLDDTRYWSTEAGNRRLRLVLDTCVDAIHDCCREEKRGLVADVHTSAAYMSVARAMIAGYARYPEMVVQVEPTWGDFSLTCPTSVVIPDIIEHNPIQMNFCGTGEYFGRSFVPTIFLGWIQQHWHNARLMAGDKLVGIGGRISTYCDNWSPLYEILPRYRHLFPQAPADGHRRKLWDGDQPVHLKLTSFDLLTAVHPAALKRLYETGAFTATDVIAEMCAREFGPETAPQLAALLSQVETILEEIFFVNKLYFGVASVLPSPDPKFSRGRWVTEAHCFYDLFQPAGSDFPNPETLKDNKTWFRCPFDGPWPAPKGLKTISFVDMVAGFASGVKHAEGLLADFQKIAPRLKPVDAPFLQRQFILLLMTAQVRYYLFQGMYFNYRLAKNRADTASRDNLARVIPQLAQAVDAIEPLVGAEDITVVVSGRLWVEEFSRATSKVQA